MADFEIPENPDFVESVRKFEPTDPAHADLFNRVILALLESLAYLRKYKADMDYVDSSYQQGTGYTDKKIADLINGAPETLDTLKEIADAIAENKTIVEALDSAIGKKANQIELDTHTSNNVIHITSAEHEGLTEAILHTKTEHVTGVKGSAESIYRTGNVEITAENVGAIPAGGNAGSAATVLDCNDTSKKIKVGWGGNSLSQDQILGVACYASGDDDIVKAKIKDVSKATFKNWLGGVSPAGGSEYYVKNENLSDIDLNNVTTTGIYHLAGNLVNSPESCNATLIVDFNVGTPYQLFIPDYNYRMYKRVKSNGNWSSWTSLFTWNNLEGKPVARKIDIGTASNFGSFSIDNQSSEGNTLKILNVMYLNEYCTFGGIDMKHYKIAVWADLAHIDSHGYCEFFIRKDSKIIKPRTSETELPSTTVNVSPFFDLQVMYGDNDKRNELEWFNEDDGRMLFTGTNGVYCFYIDCWAQ